MSFMVFFLANLLKLICFALLFLFEGHPFFQKVLPFKLFYASFWSILIESSELMAVFAQLCESIICAKCI